MHIVQVMGDFGEGGDGTLARNLAAALSQQGIRSTCVAVRRASRGRAVAGVDVIDLGAGKGAASRARALWRCRSFVGRERPGVLHVHGPQSLVFAALATAGMRARPRMWFTWHNSEAVLTEQKMRRRAILWALSRCDRIFGSSCSVVDRLKAAVPHLADRISVFRNGVPETPPVDRPANDVPVILWMARFVPPKDPQILIRAAARLRDEGRKFRVIMAGDALPHLQWYMDETRELVRKLGLEEIISMPGWVEDTQSLIRQADIGVQTSHAEGLSMTLLEMMMGGLAVVATDVGDTALAVQSPDSLVGAGEELALAAALGRFIGDEGARRAAGDAAREAAVRQFGLESVARRTLQELSIPVDEVASLHVRAGEGLNVSAE